MTVRGNRKGPKDRRQVGRRPTPSTHHGEGPWRRGYDPTRDAKCEASTIREPDDPRWDPDVPDTYVRASCAQGQEHAGWHLADDGYAWDPADDTRYALFPTAR